MAEVPDVDEVVLAVCRLPVDYESMGRFNAVELMQRSGYPTERSFVTVDRLSACLADHPDWVNAWFSWSDDTRTTPAWYIRACGPDRFEVGLHDGPGSQLPMAFDNRVRACAEFVHRAIDSIAGIDDPRRARPVAVDPEGD
jgi:hypothetical protein